MDLGSTNSSHNIGRAITTTDNIHDADKLDFEVSEDEQIGNFRELDMELNHGIILWSYNKIQATYKY